MDTILILRDSITAHVVKIVDTCQPCIQEAETNWADVKIVLFICLTVVASVLIIAITLGIAWYNYRKNKKCNDLEREKSELTDKLKDATEAKKSLEKEVERLKNKNKDKSEYEKASELLDKIASLSRPKDGITDGEIANKLFTLYKNIKNDFKGNDDKISSEG